VTPEEIRLLFDYNAWANHRSLDAAAQLSDEHFIKPLGSSFSSVRDTLVHICGTEWVWLERCHGRSPSSIPSDSHIQTVRALRAHWNPQSDNLLTYIKGLTQTELDGIMNYKTINFGAYQNPLWQSLQHMVNHGTYHRGQVSTLLRQLGVKPILMDLIHFYRERAASASA
jgi:uncharacterized damage-inducible protein DinB